MYVVAVRSISYRPAVIASPQVVVGRAFAQAWHEPSLASDTRLHEAIVDLADRLRSERRSPESAVIAFKEAIRRFAQLHAIPGLATEHNVDGDECAAVYARAFPVFVNAYFSPASPR